MKRRWILEKRGSWLTQKASLLGSAEYEVLKWELDWSDLLMRFSDPNGHQREQFGIDSERGSDGLGYQRATLEDAGRYKVSRDFEHRPDSSSKVTVWPLDRGERNSRGRGPMAGLCMHSDGRLALKDDLYIFRISPWARPCCRSKFVFQLELLQIPCKRIQIQRVAHLTFL